MKLCLFFALVLITFSCEVPKYTYYYLDGEKVIVTRIDRGLKTYLVYGKITSRKVPADYLFFKDQSILGGFEALLTYNDNKIVLLQPYAYFQQFGSKQHFEIRTIEDRAFYKMFFDTTQKKYIVIEGK
jgi:hypothetical protein